MRLTKTAAVEAAKKNLTKRNELLAKAQAKVAQAVERLVKAEKALEVKVTVNGEEIPVEVTTA